MLKVKTMNFNNKCTNFNHVVLFVVSFVFIFVFTTGCSTYLGYDDITGSETSVLPATERNHKDYIVFSGNDNQFEVSSFNTYDLRQETLTQRFITGRKEYYAEFDIDYYFTQTFIHPFPEYKSLTKKLVDDNFSLFLDFWKSSNPKGIIVCAILPPMQAVILSISAFTLMVDAIAYGGAIMLDSIVFAGCYCWTAMTMPTAWFLSRSFAWLGNWHLADHPPGILRMISYMPVINYFFLFQTPPYFLEGAYRYSRTNKFPRSEWEVIQRTIDTTIREKQRLNSFCRINARIYSPADTKGAVREANLNGHGAISLTKFVRDYIRKRPFHEKEFILNVNLLRNGSVTAQRTIRIDTERFMSAQAKSDKRKYNSKNTDCLNKILLRKRSHKDWRTELLGQDFKLCAKLGTK